MATALILLTLSSRGTPAPGVRKQVPGLAYGPERQSYGCLGFSWVASRRAGAVL